MRGFIETDDDIREALEALAVADTRLLPVIEAAGPVPLRRQKGGFAGLAEIVVSQQVSKQAAEAIWARLIACVGEMTPEAILRHSDDELGQAGLSRPKQKTVRAAAEAFHGGFPIRDIEKMSSDEAVAALVELHGIGRWTAEVYLMFCAGHPDLFPARDVALQNAVGEAFSLPSRPNEKELITIAEAWSPWRGTAARLWWAYYAAMKGGRSVIPL